MFRLFNSVDAAISDVLKKYKGLTLAEARFSYEREVIGSRTVYTLYHGDVLLGYYNVDPGCGNGLGWESHSVVRPEANREACLVWERIGTEVFIETQAIKSHRPDPSGRVFDGSLDLTPQAAFEALAELLPKYNDLGLLESVVGTFPVFYWTNHQAVWQDDKPNRFVVLADEHGRDVNLTQAPVATVIVRPKNPFSSYVEIFYAHKCSELAQEIKSWFLQVAGVGTGGGDLRLVDETESGAEAVEAGERRPSWFPKTETRLQIWRDSYEVIKKLRSKYLDLYNDLQVEDLNPSIGDFRAALARMRDWRGMPSESTVYHIIKAGDSGWLN